MTGTARLLAVMNLKIALFACCFASPLSKPAAVNSLSRISYSASNPTRHSGVTFGFATLTGFASNFAWARIAFASATIAFAMSTADKTATSGAGTTTTALRATILSTNLPNGHSRPTELLVGTYYLSTRPHSPSGTCVCGELTVNYNGNLILLSFHRPTPTRIRET